MRPVDSFASPLPEDSKLRSSFPVSADRRRALFVRILKREFLRDFSFLWDVASGRNTTRDPITQKILESLLSPESQSSWIGSVVKELSTPGHFVGSELRDQRMAFEMSLQTEVDMSRLNLLLGVVANEALRRYESFIVDRLSDDFERSIVPFATVGARRMVEYLSHFAVIDAQKKIKINLSESLLLAGLVEGQSGAWIEGHNNQPLELKQTKKDLLGRMAPMTIDAEDVYARAGMRHVEIKEGKLIDNLYIRYKSRHHDLSEWRRLQEHKKDKVHSAEFGYVRFREEKGVIQDPKAGFTVMPYAVIDRRYDFGLQESKVLSEALQAELKVSTNSVIQIDRASLVKYIAWSVSAKSPNLVAYVREVLNYPQVKRVLCSNDLSGLDFTGLDLSHCDFSGAVFSGNLNRANFNHSYLIGTVFKKGTSAQQLSLVGAFCQYLHAEEINFQGSNFNQANFEYACLKSTKLTGCQTFGTQWAYADLTGIQTDGDLFTAQTQHIVKLQAALLEQREELFELTRQLSALQEAPQALISELDKQADPQLQALSAQVQTLVQQQQDRLIFEAECKQELAQFDVAVTRATDKNEIKQLKAQLEETQDQFQQLKAGVGFKTALQEFQVQCDQQFKNLGGELKSNLTTLQQQVTQDFNNALQLQEKRLENLIQNMSHALTALDGRVNVLEQWIKKAEATLAGQETERAEAKQSMSQIKTLLENLRKDLQQEQEKRQNQERQLDELQKKIVIAPDTVQVRQLQGEIKQLQTQWAIEEKSEQPPPQLVKALADKQAELKQSQVVLEKAAYNASLRQKLQDKINQAKDQQTQWTVLAESLNSQWQMQSYIQDLALEKLQKINEICEQRILKLEADVQQLQAWAKETQARLASMETEEGETQSQLHSLQSEMSNWVKQQEKFQAQLDELRQGKKDKATLLELESELKGKGDNGKLLARIEAVKTLYNGQQEALAQAIEVDVSLRETLQSDQEAIREKLKLLSDFEKNFQEKQQIVFQKFRSEIQEAIKSLEKQVIELDDKVVTIQHRVDTSDPRYTLAVRLKALRQKILEDKYIHDELDYYIAPNGQHLPGSESTTPLLEWITQNFIESPVRTLLLQGPGGIGKSTFNRFLLRYLWQNPAWEKFQPGDLPPKALVPFFVPLGSNRVNPRRLFDYLGDLPELVEDFTDAEINILKSEYQILWIADGYDEMPGGAKLNLYDLNNIDSYEGRSKLLISRRSDPPLTTLDEKLYFIPKTSTIMKPLYRSYFVAPFTQDQIKAYIDQYLRNKRVELPQQQPGSVLLWQDSATYLQHFQKIKKIDALVSTPFLLMITVETLPGIILKVEREQAAQSSQVETKTSGKIDLTEKRLLDEFMDNWFTRQAMKPAQEFLENWYYFLDEEVVEAIESKHQPANDPRVSLLKLCYRKFCQEFAKNLQKEELVVVQYPPSRGPRIGTSATSTGAPASWIMELFDSNNKDMAICRRGSPLKTQDLGHGKIEYGFLHAQLIHYFVTTIVEDEAMAAMKETEKNQEVQQGNEFKNSLSTAAPGLSLFSVHGLPATSQPLLSQITPALLMQALTPVRSPAQSLPQGSVLSSSGQALLVSNGVSKEQALSKASGISQSPVLKDPMG